MKDYGGLFENSILSLLFPRRAIPVTFLFLGSVSEACVIELVSEYRSRDGCSE